MLSDFEQISFAPYQYILELNEDAGSGNYCNPGFLRRVPEKLFGKKDGRLVAVLRASSGAPRVG